MKWMERVKDALPADAKVISIEFGPKTVGGSGKMNRQTCVVVYEFNGEMLRTMLRVTKGTEKIQ